MTHLNLTLPLLCAALLANAWPQTAQADAWPDDHIGSGLGIAAKPERTHDDDLEKIRSMGFSYVRFDLRWREVEHQKGRYDWDKFDRFIAALRAHGLKPILILGGGNALYTGTVEVPPDQSFGYPTAPAAPTTDDAIGAYLAFVTAAVQRYGSGDVIWETWNEPDILAFWPPKPDATAFEHVLALSCQAIRNAAPEASIIGPSITHLPNMLDKVRPGFLESVLTPRVVNCLDAVSVHTYRLKQPPETVSDDYAHIYRPIIAAHKPAGKPALPLVNSEWGYTLTHASPDQQAAYDLRLHLVNLMNGVPLSVIYEYSDTRPPNLAEDNDELHFGLVDHDGADKAASRYFAAIMPRIKDAVIEKRIPLPRDDIYALLIRQPGGQKQVLAWLASGNGADRAAVRFTHGDSSGQTYTLSLEPILIDRIPAEPALALVSP